MAKRLVVELAAFSLVFHIQFVYALAVDYLLVKQLKLGYKSMKLAAEFGRSIL
ncbi:MAG: hypothetical protein R3C28_00230 [Pirellulaceae bacterium]